MKIDVKGVIVPNDEAWIYKWFGEDHTSPSMVASKLQEADGEDVDIDINSLGGDVWSGSEIYSAIREYKGNITIHVVGIAASAASMIACAGKSDIAPTGQMMVHNTATRAAGDYHEMDKSSERLRKANKAVAAAYITKSGMSEKEALDMMDVETWLTAEEAVEYGLIDAIAESKNANHQKKDIESERLAASVNGMLPQSVIDKMQEQRRSLMDYFKS